LYKSIENLDEKVKGAAMKDIQNFISTLNGLASNALSAKKSVDSLSDNIEDLNKKIKDTQKAELFRVKEERWSNIDQELKKIARELSRVERLQKNLTGDALIKNLEH
jgi:peptidoglycan hydrolase CwlO-like protein